MTTGPKHDVRQRTLVVEPLDAPAPAAVFAQMLRAEPLPSNYLAHVYEAV